MGKAILFSILVATIAVPMRAARDPSPVQGLRRAIVWMAGFNLLYLIAFIYIYPRLM